MMMRCFFCSGEINGPNMGDDITPTCDFCHGMMQKGFMLVEVKDGQKITSNVDDIEKTGRIVVVDPNLIAEKIGLPMQIIQKVRFMFVDKKVLEELIPGGVLDKVYYDRDNSEEDNNFKSNVLSVVNSIGDYVVKQFQDIDEELAPETEHEL
jgi:hypothetical protein